MGKMLMPPKYSRTLTAPKTSLALPGVDKA
jgi:hypothetical protein